MNKFYSHFRTFFFLFSFIIQYSIFNIQYSIAQSVGIFGSTSLGVNNSGAHGNASSVFDISAIGKGILIPRMTAAQIAAMNPLPVPAQGLLVYQTDGTQGFYYNTSTTTTLSLVQIAAGGASAPWTRNGTDVFLTNSSAGDSVGIGVASPWAKLHVVKVGVGNAFYSTTSGSGNAIFGYNSGTGTAGLFQVANAGSAGAAVSAVSNGSGAAIVSDASGTGRAAKFEISNVASTSDAAYITTSGQNSKVLHIEHPGTGGGGINYGVYSIINGARGAGSTNIAGYFSSSGATNNYAGIFDQGNVGIGTTAPGVKVDVVGNGRFRSNGNVLHIQQNSAGSNAYIRFQDAVPTDFGWLGYGAGADELEFWTQGARALSLGTNTSERLKIDASGNIRLNAYTTNGILRTTGGTGTLSSSGGAINLTSEVTGVLPVANGGTALSAAPANGQLLIGNGTNYTQSTLTGSSGINVTNGAGSISIGLSGGSLSGGTTNYIPKWSSANSLSSTSLMYDNGSGVGIGTTAPYSNFHVASPANTLATISSTADPAGTLAGIKFLMYVSATNTHYDIAAEKTDAVPNSGQADLVFRKNFSTAGGYLTFLKYDNITNNVILNSDKTTASAFGNVLIPNGNVGIGTAAPDATLHSLGSTATIISDNANTTYSGGGKMYPGGYYYATILGGGGGWTSPDGGGMPGAKFIGGNGGTSYGGGGAGIVAIGGNGAPWGRSGAGIYAKAGTDGVSASDGIPAVAGYFDGNSTNAILAMNGNVGIGTTTPTALFDVGATSQFQVNSSGNIIKLNNVTTSFPAANASGTLTNNGSGTLSWTGAGATGGGLPSGASGQTLRHDGANWVANSILFNNGTNVGIGSTTPAARLDVLNNTASGNSGNFAINNAGNPDIAVNALTNGTGYAGYFLINNAANANNAVLAGTTGAGEAIYGSTVGTGIAGYFTVSNASNASSALQAETNGSGNAIWGFTNGTGRAGYFNIANATNTSDGLFVTTNGTGKTLRVSNTNTAVGTKYGVYSTAVSAAGNTGVAGYFSSTGAGTNNAGIFENGNVGIGTTVPLSKLNVAGISQYEAALLLQNFSANNSEPRIMMTKSRNAAIGGNTIVSTNDITGQVGGWGNDGTTFWPNGTIEFEVDGVPGLNDMPGRITFNTTPDGSQILSERMRITSTGNIGIGTTNPVEILQIKSIDSDIEAETFSAVESSSLHIKRARGTIAAPSIVFSGDYFGGIAFEGHDGSIMQPAGRIQGIVDGVPGLGDMPGRIEFWTTADGTVTEAVRMTIKNDGDVGIGTTAPIAKLDIRTPNVVTASATAGNLHVMTTNAQAIDFGGSISLGGFNDDAGTLLRVFGTIEGRKTTAGTGSSSGYLAFKTNNGGSLGERMRIDNTGKVGIGTTVPSQKLHLYQATGPTELLLESDGAAGSDAPGITLDASGQNTGSSTITFTENGVYKAGTGWSTLATQQYWFVYDGGTAQSMVYKANNFGIGTTVPGYRLTVNGQPAANGYTAFTNYSDARLKKNIIPISSSLDKIMQLRPVQFNYNEEYLNLYNDTNTLARVQKGFIAQEVKEIFPEMVGTSLVKDKEYFDLNLSNLQIYLVKAMQEQQEIIDSLKKTISLQQSAMDELLNENATLRSEYNTFKSDMLRVNEDLEKIKGYLELKSKK